MRVALVTSEAPFGRGERFVEREAGALQAAGLEVVAFPVHQNRGRPSTSPNLPSKRLGLFGLAHFTALLRALTSERGRTAIKELLVGETRLRVLCKNFVAIPFACQLAFTVERDGIEHIHAAWMSVPASAAFLASRLTGVPWSFSAHRWDIVEGNAATLKLSSATFARTISAWGRDRLRDLAPDETSARRIHLVHLGVVIPPHAPPLPRTCAGAEFTIVTIGNLIPVKGHTYLLEACGQLAEMGISFQLRLIGDGPLRAMLQAKAESLGIRACVEFWGHVDGAVVEEALTHAHVSVLASVTTGAGEHEGIPSSLIESMVAGIPVVATRSGSIPELITHGCGLLVSERDAAALAKALVKLSSDQNLRNQLAAAGRQRVEWDFSERKTTEEMTALLGWPRSRLTR